MRVALVSVSGVRVKTRELAELGVTLPGFVERGRVIASLPSLAHLTLAAVTPADVAVDYLEASDADDAFALEGYDLVALSTFTAGAYDCYAIADRCRSLGIPTVIGGLHATAMPEEAKRHADAVCIGEGEALWPKILEDAERGTLAPYYREERRGSWDLAKSPVPRYELLDLARYNRLTVQTSRGCPLDCEFCAASKIYGAYRIKPVDQIMREIDAIRGIWRHPFIELADDNTFVDKRWSKEFLRAIAKRDVRWFTETDISVADDPELVDLLADSGCQQVLVGFETLVPESFRGLDRADFKAKRRDTYARAIDTLQSRGVTVNGCFIVGLDGDDEGVFDGIRDFVRDTKLLEVQLTVATPFPNTRLYHRLRAEGRLLADEYWDRCTLFDVTFRPKRMSIESLEAGLRHAFIELYSEAALAGRRRHFVDLEKARIRLRAEANS